SQVIALGLMPDTGTITNYFAQVRRLWCPVSGGAVGHLRQIDTLPTPSACPLCPAKADKYRIISECRPVDCRRKPSARRLSADGACAIRHQFLSIAPADDSAGKYGGWSCPSQ